MVGLLNAPKYAEISGWEIELLKIILNLGKLSFTSSSTFGRKLIQGAQ